MCFPLLLLPLALPLAQEPEKTPLPENAVARLGDRVISKQEYLDYLWFRFGKRALRDYIMDLLLEEEAERYQIKIEEAAVQAKVQEREDAARRSPRPVDFEEDLLRQGQTIEMFRQTIAHEIRQDMILGELVRQSRVVTDEKIQQAFQAKYGEGGVKVKLRHILVMPNFLKAQAIRGGAKPNEVDMEQIRKDARALVEGARQRLQGGAEFEAVCASVSHDQVTKDKGGELAHYNGRLYGPAFREAVLALQPGELSQVVESGAGFHLIRLDDRIATQLEDVRQSLIEEIMASEPSWQEKSSFRQALQTRAELRLQLW